MISHHLLTLFPVKKKTRAAFVCYFTSGLSSILARKWSPFSGLFEETVLAAAGAGAQGAVENGGAL